MKSEDFKANGQVNTNVYLLLHPKATGKGTYLYHLDSGVYTNHNEFGGRAVGGYSAGCDGVTACLPGWLPKGVVTDAVLNGPVIERFGTTCDGHGTHTASAAAGK